MEERLGELLAERTPALRDAAQKERQGQRQIERQRQRQIDRQRQSDEETEREQYRAACAPHLTITTYIPAGFQVACRPRHSGKQCRSSTQAARRT